MKVNNRKKGLPGFVAFVFMLIQHCCAAVACMALAYLLINLCIIDKFDMNITSGYSGTNIYQTPQHFEESKAYQEIFLNYSKKAIVDSVICSQFGIENTLDGTVEVDVVAYANRKYPKSDGMNYSVKYTLDDLLKWAKYGLETETLELNEKKEFERYFPGLIPDINQKSVNEIVYYVSEIAREYPSLESYIFSFQNVDETFLAIKVPIERYSPAGEHKTLAEYASGLDEYFYLTSKLKECLTDVSFNFATYEKEHKLLDDETTRFRYCIEIYDETGKTTKRYTNFPAISHNFEYTTKNSGSAYFVWDRAKAVYDSTLPKTTSETIVKYFKDYEYTLQENVRVYFTVDNWSNVQDEFATAYMGFVISRDSILYLGIAIAGFVIWFGWLLYLSVKAGYKKVNGEIQISLKWFDHIPTEIYLGIVACIIVFVAFVWSEFVYSLDEFLNWYSAGNEDYCMCIITIIAVALSIIFNFFWFSLVRRLKARTFLTQSIIYRFFSWLFKMIGKGISAIVVQIQYIYNHSSDAAKIIWPSLILVVLHFLVVPFAGMLVLTGLDYGGIEGVIGLLIYAALFAIDALVAITLFKSKVSRSEIIQHIKRIEQGEMDLRLTEENYKGENRQLAESVNNIGNGIKNAVETSMKDERMKADLITNVSHDIKTPLTSIINYVDLLKRENIDTEPIKGYIEVLDAKSQRLKQLTDDLVEASKISSGNIVLHMDRINLAELLKQSVGEFSEKFEQKRYTVVENYGNRDLLIYADARRMWRIIENLFNNIYKYGLEGTRVYIDICSNTFGDKNQVILSVKNISSNQLGVKPEELTERFVRGDDSRTTEGSGLGLSIAKSLVEAQGGTFNIILDGDLFKIVILFDEATDAGEVLTDNEI